MVELNPQPIPEETRRHARCSKCQRDLSFLQRVDEKYKPLRLRVWWWPIAGGYYYVTCPVCGGEGFASQADCF